MRAESEFDVVGWDPSPYDNPHGGVHLSRATVRKTFKGDLDGESTAELLMCQADVKDLSAGAGYVASEVVSGKLGSRTGTFVLQHWGLSGGGAAPTTAGHVVHGSGTDQLVGLSGTVEIAASVEGKHTLTMEYELPDGD